MELHLTNSLSGKKERFTPLDSNNIGMYVCGPTVYARAHVGNARAVVVYDVLYRLLQHAFPKVTYVRNITDVDDKINTAAKENGEPISTLTARVTKWFHEDMAALGNLPPSIEPRATAHIGPIIALIERMMARGHAYIAENHVLCDVPSIKEQGDYHYGQLSGKKQEDLVAGARIEVESYKRHPSDFVLWKPAPTTDDPSSVFESPWGPGRPGWHIECSAMSTEYLTPDFDIHGGGADLKFPHHENEIAQSRCANPGSAYARYWVHNGFVTVEGEKMSKSLGNITTVHALLEQGFSGEAIRLHLLSRHYAKPLDFTTQGLMEAEKTLEKLYRALALANKQQAEGAAPEEDPAVREAMVTRTHNAHQAFLAALADDMNTPAALAELYIMAKGIRSLQATPQMIASFKEACALLGIVQEDPETWLAARWPEVDADQEAWIEQQIAARAAAKKAKDWAKADAIRAELSEAGITLEDTAEGTLWRQS